MDRKALQDEILALEQTLNCGPQRAQDDLLLDEEEIMDDEELGTMYSQDILDEEIVEEIVEEPEEIGLEEEIAALEEQLGCVRRTQDLENEYESINDEDESIIEEGTEGDTGFFDEDQNTKISRRRDRRFSTLDNPEEDRGLLWQDHSGVEQLMGVEGLTDNGNKDDGDILDADIVQTDVSDADIIYAKNLQSASQRLDRVATELESRGGKWVNFAYRLDQLSNVIDKKRKVIASRIASRLAD